MTQVAALPEAQPLLEQLVFQDVARAVDTEALSTLERRLAVELARLGEPSDTRMLAIARGLIARALLRLAHDLEAGVCADDRDLEIRYENAICREVLAELDAAAAASPPSA